MCTVQMTLQCYHNSGAVYLTDLPSCPRQVPTADPRPVQGKAKLTESMLGDLMS